MATNSIALAKNFIPMLDEVYQRASVTSDLTSDATLIRAGANVKEIIYPQVSTGGLGDYSRTAGYTDAGVTLEWKTTTFNYDRGARITVDTMDNAESMNLAFARAVGEFLRLKVAPEADAFTFATLASKAGKKATGALADAEAFLAALLKAKDEMDELEVPEEGRLLYATPTLMNSIMALDTWKSREVLNAYGVKKIVPQARFFTAIELLDGKTAGEEAGHFRKDAAGKDINFMIVHKPAVIKWDKHVASDIIAASANHNMDADIMKYRKYGIVDVFMNKVNGLYVHHKA